MAYSIVAFHSRMVIDHVFLARHERGRGTRLFPVQLTTCSCMDNKTRWLMPNQLWVLTAHILELPPEDTSTVCCPLGSLTVPKRQFREVLFGWLSFTVLDRYRYYVIPNKTTQNPLYLCSTFSSHDRYGRYLNPPSGNKGPYFHTRFKLFPVAPGR